MKRVTVAEVQYIAHRLAKEIMEWDEPIPEFQTRFPNVLESSLAAPFQSFGGHSPYRGLSGKAAALFYLLVKNHPFQNGNKRIAVATLFYFLYSNEKWLTIDNKELYNFAKWVASSNPRLKKETMAAVQKFIELNLVNR